jgi:hypothetical protein
VSREIFPHKVRWKLECSKLIGEQHVEVAKAFVVTLITLTFPWQKLAGFSVSRFIKRAVARVSVELVESYCLQG